MAFDEIQFPVNVSRGALSIPKRHVTVVSLRSGFEQRNTTWANSRRSYNIGLGIRDIDDVYNVIDFWEGRRSGLRAFRFKDWSDFKSCRPNGTPSNTDENMLLLTTTTFQLQKVYSVALNPWTRDINKPVDNGTITIKDDTGDLIEITDYTVDYTTGIVTFGVAPTGTPSAGFEFDVPVRFKDEELQISVELAQVGAVPDVGLIEVRI